MHTHDHDPMETALRPKGARLETRPSAPTLRAGATGRSDVLDAESILGLQRAVGNAGVGAMLEEERSPVHDVVSSGGGSALAPDVQREMQARLGHDFSDVRVHTDAQASDSAKAVNAHAYTVGSNVVFQRDKYDPDSSSGKTMLAHELTHVVQQRSGPVDGTEGPGGVKISDPSDRFEREAAANAESVMAKPLSETASGQSAAPPVQRHEDDEVQRCAAPEHVQREGEGEEEEEESVQTFVQRDAETEEEEEMPS